MEQAAKVKSIFDRKFVVPASIIGCVGVLIVVGIMNLMGPEASGVAGVALTVLVTGVLKRFGSPRFTAVEDEEYLDIFEPRPNPWQLILMSFTFTGAHLLFGMFAGTIAIKLGILDTGLSGRSAMAKEVMQWEVISITTCLQIFSYFVASFFARKAFVVIRYSTVLYAALLALILQILFSLIDIAIRSGLTSVIVALKNIWGTSFWPFYVAAALIGVRLAKVRSERPSNISEVPQCSQS